MTLPNSYLRSRSPVSPAFRVIATGTSPREAIRLADVTSQALIAYEAHANTYNPDTRRLLREYPRRLAQPGPGDDTGSRSRTPTRASAQFAGSGLASRESPGSASRRLATGPGPGQQLPVERTEHHIRPPLARRRRGYGQQQPELSGSASRLRRVGRWPRDRLCACRPARAAARALALSSRQPATVRARAVVERAVWRPPWYLWFAIGLGLLLLIHERLPWMLHGHWIFIVAVAIGALLLVAAALWELPSAGMMCGAIALTIFSGSSGKHGVSRLSVRARPYPARGGAAGIVPASARGRRRTQVEVQRRAPTACAHCAVRHRLGCRCWDARKARLVCLICLTSWV